MGNGGSTKQLGGSRDPPSYCRSFVDAYHAALVDPDNALAIPMAKIRLQGVSATTPILRAIVRHGRLRPLASPHVALVHKARIAPEPLSCTQGACAAVRAFLRPFKGSFAYDNEMGNRHRAETSEAVVTSTLHPPRRRYGWADGIGAAAVLECPEEATRGICRAISQGLLHMDG